MIDAFDLAHVGRSAARFDFVKLESMNGHYMRMSKDEDLLAALDAALPYLPNAEAILPKYDATMRAKLLRAMPGLKERAKTLIELLDGANFLFAERPLPLDEKAKTILTGDGRTHLTHLVPRFSALPDWTAAATEDVVRTYVDETKVKLGQVAQPLRAALTGRSTSPGIFDVLEVLGRDESLSRLQDQSD
jgi:glutamyl-tRNA synthetase